MKKLLLLASIFTAMLLCMVAFLVLPASAEVYSGNCGTEGDNVTWTLDTETGLLEISGSGEMKNYTYSFEVPWDSYLSSVKTVHIGNGNGDTTQKQNRDKQKRQ